MQAALRAARAHGGGAAWLRAAAALARLQRWDEAGAALLEAAAAGHAIGEAAAALEPPGLAPFEAALLAGPEAHVLDWGPDGRELYLADGEAVWRYVNETGARQRLAALPAPAAALGAGPAPAALLLGLLGDDGGLYGCHAVAWLELATGCVRQSGWASGRAPRGALVWDAGTGAAIWCDGQGAEALRVDQPALDPSRSWGRRRVRWRAARAPSAADRAGWVIQLGRAELASWRVGDREPRRVLAGPPEAALAAPGEVRLLAAGGDRAVVCAGGLARLHAAAGELGRAPLPPPGESWGALASPSGRFVALLLRADALLLLDLLRGERRRLPLPGRPRAAAWSPSGRRLAVAAGARLVMLGA